MNMDANMPVEGSTPQSENAALLNRGFEGLQPFLAKSLELRQALVRLGKIGDKGTNRAARKLHHQLKFIIFSRLSMVMPFILSVQ